MTTQLSIFSPMVSLAYAHHVRASVFNWDCFVTSFYIWIESISAKHNKTTAAARSAIFAVELYHLSFSHKHTLEKSILHKDESTEKKGTKFSLLCFLCVCEWAGRGRFWEIFWNSGSEPGFRLPFVCTLHACTSVLALSDRCRRSWMWRSVHLCGVNNISCIYVRARECDAKADISSGLSSNFPSPPWAFVHWT